MKKSPEWVAIAQASGMKYIVLTAKHCDGFCLWHSKVADYNISKSPFVRDVCAELAIAAHTAGIKVGWYYSPMDWRDPDCRTERNTRYVASMQGQLRELLGSYGRMDLLWFDTDGKSAPWDQKNTYGLVSTNKGNVVYIHALEYDGDTIRLPALPRKIIESNVLTGGVVQLTQTEAALYLTVVKDDQQEIDTIIKLTLDGPAARIPPVTIEE